MLSNFTRRSNWQGTVSWRFLRVSALCISISRGFCKGLGTGALNLRSSASASMRVARRASEVA